MSHRDELVRAAKLLAVAMSAGSVLSACQQQSTQPPAPNVTQGGTTTNAQNGTTAAGDVSELRRAAGVLRDSQRRDPAGTAQVLAEMGLFACDETTTACIAAKTAHEQNVAGAQPNPPPPAPPPQPSQPPPSDNSRPPNAVA